MKVTSCLREIRARRGLSASELAQQIGVTRQSVHAIESGAYAPNTTVALKLAHLLEVSVEDLFQLPEAERRPMLRAEAVAGPIHQGAQLRVGRVGNRMVAVPWSSELFALPVLDAAAVSKLENGFVDVRLRGPESSIDDRLLIAGCDPAVSLLAEYLRNATGTDLIAIPSSSSRAIEMLRDGLVHMAGTHLGKRSSRVPNGCSTFAYAEWEEGLVVASGNPKGLRSLADVCRGGVRIINRDAGSGSRALLDEGLENYGADAADVKGYEDLAAGHLAAALKVKRGDADCCVAPRIAAQAFDLSFVPLVSERYDIVISDEWIETRSVQALLNALQRSTFRRELSALGGYDTRSTGERVSGPNC